MGIASKSAAITVASNAGRILHATHADGLTVAGLTVWVVVVWLFPCVVVTLVVEALFVVALEAADAGGEL
jgi:hypothetical protein